jgi:signal transduction histidine kinase
MAPNNATPPIVWIVGGSPLDVDTSRRALGPTCETRVFADAPALFAEFVQADPPDALVLDWQSPEGSPRDVCLRIRESHDAAALPIVALTTSRREGDLLAMRDAGVNDHVAKPFADEELSNRVAIAVQTKRLSTIVRNTAAFRAGFVGALGHDLRQPLSTLSMGASVLITRNLAENDAKIARRLHNATQRMTRMISDLFDLARSEIGAGMSIERRPLDFHEACREIVEEAQLANAGRTIVLEASGDGSGSWDRGRLQQACANLIANALRHGETSAPIVVTASSNAEQVTLAVASRGPQIPAEVRATLFDPYRAPAGDGREPKDALGLGLFIVREIARGHGGSVRIESDEVQTVFSVQLPRRHVTPATQESASV